MEKTREVVRKNPVKPVEDVLRDMYELLHDYMNVRLLRLAESGKKVKARSEQGGTPRSLLQERARLRARRYALLNDTESSDDDLTEATEQLENLQLHANEPSIIKDITAEIQEYKSHLSAQQMVLREIEDELNNFKRVQDLSRQQLGLDVENETKDVARQTQTVRLRFNKIVEWDPQKESVLRLMLKDSKFTDLDTIPPLPRTPELKNCIEEARADPRQLKALIRQVRREFTRIQEENKLRHSATVLT